MSSLWHKIQTANQQIFPILVLTFLGFALTEEFRPGFFTFYISQWVFILPVLVSALIFATTPAERIAGTQQHWPQWLRWLALAVFEVLFVLAFLWRVTVEPIWLQHLLLGIAALLFLLFQWALLFSALEQEALLATLKISWQRRRGAIGWSLVFLLLALAVILFFWWLINPVEWYL